MADRQQLCARKILFPSIDKMYEVVVIKTQLDEDLVAIVAMDNEGEEDHLLFHPDEEYSAMEIASNLSRIFGLPYEDKR